MGLVTKVTSNVVGILQNICTHTHKFIFPVQEAVERQSGASLPRRRVASLSPRLHNVAPSPP